MDTQVFVSYASKDKYFVEQELIPVLHDLEVEPWYADREIIPARHWETEIRRGLSECDWFLVVISEASVHSDWVRTEVHWAFELKPTRIIPVLIDESEPGDCHMKLKLIQHVRWGEGAQKARHGLVSALTAVYSEGDTANGATTSHEGMELVPRLRALRAAPETSQIPFLFECLAHDDEGIRGRAMQVVQKIGWDEVAASIETVAMSGLEGRIEEILSGLAAIEATDKTVATLAKLCEILSGDLRDRVLALTERKRLSLQLGDIAKLFRNFHQPYRLVRVLGLGLFTASYLAKHRHSGQEVVVRVLRPELALQDDIRTQYVELTNRSTQYVHQNLAHTSYVNQFAEDKVYFCIRDYIDGISLQRALGAGQHFEPTQIIKMLKQIASAFSPIHARVEFHGGVKPSNIFLVGERTVLLGDPSLPVSLLPPNLERLAYDYRYAAPESFHIKYSLGPPADYYSLGCVAYELLCGEPPFTSDHPFHLANFHREKSITAPSQLRETLTPESDELLLMLLNKNPNRRPGNVGELMQILDELAECILSPAQKALESVPILEPGKRRAIPSDSTRIVMPSPAELDVDRTYFKRVPTPACLRGSPSSTGEQQSAAPPEKDLGQGRTPAHLRDNSDVIDESGKPLSFVDTVTEVSDSADVEKVKGVGDVLNDRFVLEELVGAGGMSTVYKALDRRKFEANDRNPYVAIKVLNVEFRAHPDSLIALQREAEKSQRLAHPNIVRVFDFDRDASTVYMTMEYLSGRSLYGTLREPGFKGMPLNEAMRIVDGMAKALSFAHENGIVHADFKPGNVFLTDKGEVKVIDFGIARAFKRPDDGAMEATRFDPSSLGALTPTYASPEMLEQQMPDPRDDIYALACITYEMLTGRHPFGRMQATEARDGGLTVVRRKKLSRRQWRALKSALNFDREHRTPSVERFMEDLRDYRSNWVARLLRLG